MQLIISAVLYLSLVTSKTRAKKWRFSGINGPEVWFVRFPQCAGARQSPVNIVSATLCHGPVKPISFPKPRVVLLPENTLVNTGYGVHLIVPDYMVMKFFPQAIEYCFKLMYIDWHWGANNSLGSEHQLNGKSFPLEMHIVTYDCHLFKTAKEAMSGVNGLAILAVWYEVDDDAPPIEQLDAIIKHFDKPKFRQCPGDCNETNYPTEKLPGFNIVDLLPDDTTHFYRYMGSMTEPPCTENVLWTVYSKPKRIPGKQIQAFRSLLFARYMNSKVMANNFRPIQLLNPILPIRTHRCILFNSASTGPVTSLMLPTLAVLIVAFFSAC